MAVGVVTDSACDLPQALADGLGIRIVPLTVRFGTDELVDRRDLTPSEFWARCAASAAPPETAAPAPGQFEAAYRALAAAGVDAVVVVSLSGLLSGAHQSAQLAAHVMADALPVEVVDSRSASAGQGMVAVAAARRARDGAGLAEVAALARELAGRTHVHGVLDDVGHLRRGGRMGATAAWTATALDVKPLIEIRDGQVTAAGHRRTRARAVSGLVDHVAAVGPLDALAVLHAEAPDVDDLVTRLAPLAPGPLLVMDIGAAIGAHCGPGAIGVAYQTKAAPTERH